VALSFDTRRDVGVVIARATGAVWSIFGLAAGERVVRSLRAARQLTGSHMTEHDPAAIGWEMTRLIDGFVVTQLLYVAARLGVAESLADGPRSHEEIARECGAEADMLRRVMRGLAAEGVFAETDDGRFELAPLGEAFRGLQGAALVRGDVYYGPAAGLYDAVVEGGVPFDRVNRSSFFDHLRDHPAQEAMFQASMAGRAQNEAASVVEAYDFGSIRHIVDVGGGRGVLLAEILRAFPAMTGTLLDREAAIPDARDFLDDAGLATRVACVVGDFFASVPSGFDAYVLSRVLHDWHDEDALRILDVCRAAMGPGSRLLVVDAVLPERAVDNPAAIRMDLHMLLLFGAGERTQAEFVELFERAGLRLAAIHPTRSTAGLAVLEALPA
jgi:SAM-dependent methyltransferase